MVGKYNPEIRRKEVREKVDKRKKESAALLEVIVDKYVKEVEKNLKILHSLLIIYFTEGGAGANLEEDKQVLITDYARRLLFHWSKKNIAELKSLKPQELEAFLKVAEKLETGDRFGLIVFEKIDKRMDELGISSHQKAGIEKRATILAQKALGLGRQIKG